jgi:hypothetical protein
VAPPAVDAHKQILAVGAQNILKKSVQVRNDHTIAAVLISLWLHLIQDN